MASNRNKLYLFLMLVSLAGYFWILFNLKATKHEIPGMNVCLFKHLTSIPCPSCGTTRSVMFLLQARFSEAFFSNPLGFLMLPFLVLIPPWIALDWLRHQSSLYGLYHKAELIVQKKAIVWLLVILILINWIWNIVKNN